jgi:cell division septation protein DedD
MGNKILFSVMIFLMSSFTFSCEPPDPAGKSDNSKARLIIEPEQISENREIVEETIEDDKIAAESGNIVEANNKGTAAEPVKIAAKSESGKEITETGKQGVVAEHEDPAVLIENNYIIQVGAYKHINYANDTVKNLKAMNLCAFITRENNFSKVRVAGIRTKESAALIMKEINNKFKLSPVLFSSKKASMINNPCK